jgi:hypothetical protein
MPDSGLLWVGHAYYPTTTRFLAEGAWQGISRRIPHVPRDLSIGHTPVFLAHGAAYCGPPTHIPRRGIFAFFIPTAVEYVVRDNDPPERLEELQSHGLTLVTIVRVECEPPLLPDALP